MASLYDLVNHKVTHFHDPISRFHHFDTDGHYSKVGRAEWGRSGRIAEAFVQMKLHRWATIASLEILYANQLQNLQQARSWIYKTPTIHWDAIAQAQWQLGNEQQLAGALARVIVFGYNGVKDDALQLLTRWREEGLPKQPEAAQPDAEQLKMVISLYAELNMHPRSFELLREFGDVIGPQAVELREKYEKEWPGKVRVRPSLPHGYLIFGQEIDTPEKRLKITVPPPLRPEMIEEAKQVMMELELGA